MLSKKFVIPILFLIFSSRVDSASIFETSYEYVINLGKSIAPSFMSILDCMGEPEAWSCAKEKAGKMLDGWNEEVEKERRSWREAADAEVRSTGRSLEEMPSTLGEDVEKTLGSLAELVNYAMARALSRKKHEGGGIDTITISTSDDKKKMKKKKEKPAKIHLIHVPTRKANKEEKGRSFPNGRQTWIIGDRLLTNQDMTKQGNDVTDSEKDLTERDITRNSRDMTHQDLETDLTEEDKITRNSRDMTHQDLADFTEEDIPRNEKDLTDDVTGVDNFRVGKGIMTDLWSMGNEALDAVAEHALETEQKDNGIKDKSSFEEQRGKKKKKKKAILKLLILGAVLKAKIGTLLQILSFKLQVKFFIVAVLGLAINLARLWIDLKNKHSHQPQKVIYYEHAQHQHHYDHEEEPESHGWGPWSRSMEPEEQTEVEVDVDFHNTPYRRQERDQFYRTKQEQTEVEVDVDFHNTPYRRQERH